MSSRLGSRVEDPEEGLTILRKVHYEARRADLDPQLVLALIHVESNFDRVGHQEQARHDPCGALVSVNEWVVAGNAECIGCGQLHQFILAVVPAIDGPGQRRFQCTCMAQANAAASQKLCLPGHMNARYNSHRISGSQMGSSPMPGAPAALAI